MMKNLLRVAGTIALLVAIYYLLQVLLITASMAVAVLATNLPIESMEMVNDAQFLKDNPALAAAVVNVKAVGLFLSALVMLLFIHFRCCIG